MKTEHTPTPWTFDDTWSLILGSRGEEVAAIHSGSLEDSNRCNRNTALDNAELIVLAVNHFEAMREALKIAERTIQHRQGDCYSNDYMGVCVCGKDKIAKVLSAIEQEKSR